MTETGKSIRIFLADGTPQGVLTAEIGNWIGHVLMFPRGKIAEVMENHALSRTGVYFLLGPDPEDAATPLVYVGESDKLHERLIRHSRDETRDFWERACIVTSRDRNLTKAHARYLESRLIAIIRDTGQAKLFNTVAPEPVSLPESDIADMQYFLHQLQLVLPVLGLDFLRRKPVIHPASPTQAPVTEYAAIVPRFNLYSRKHDLRASALEIDGDFILLSGSETQTDWIGVPHHGYHALFRKLFAANKIVIDPDSRKGVAQEDIPFTSPSAAAAIVLGRSSNGRVEWKLAGSDHTYEEWQNALLAPYDGAF
jgi:hypothetical protein